MEKRPNPQSDATVQNLSFNVSFLSNLPLETSFGHLTSFLHPANPAVRLFISRFANAFRSNKEPPGVCQVQWALCHKRLPGVTISLP